MTRRKREAGQVLVFAAVALAVLLGFLGLAIDVGYLRHMKRKMQRAADAGAVGGASELFYGHMVSAAKADSSVNGFTDGVNGTTITVNNPPVAGQYVNDTRAVEVTVAQAQPTFFMKALGVQNSMVSARAVAHWGGGTGCIYALNPNASQAFVASGSACVIAQCGIVVDSNNSRGIVVSGGATVAGKSIGVVGSSGSVNSSETACPVPSGTTTKPIYSIMKISDPLAYLQPPTYSPVPCLPDPHITGGTVALNPGVYCGITVSGNNDTAILNPGTYILTKGGLTVSGGAGVQGNGVTIYNAPSSGSITVSGGSGVSLTAPTSGPYAGILFYQDPKNAKNATVSGGSSTIVEGALYFPGAHLEYSGGSQFNSDYMIIVADTLTFSGNSYVNNNYFSLPDGQPVKTVVLVE